MIEERKFQRTVEDFVCGNCSKPVLGTGYTNHCPKCLWSKHVDINPGDRAASCGGMMEPIGLAKTGQEFSVIQKCRTCGFERHNKLAKGDNFDAAVEIIEKNTAPHNL